MDEKEILLRIQNGEYEYFDKIVVLYGDTIKKLARSIWNNQKTGVVEVDDLYQIGLMQLFNSVFKFDVNRDNKFITFALKSIKTYMNRFLIRYTHPFTVPYNKGIIPDDSLPISELLDPSESSSFESIVDFLQTLEEEEKISLRLLMQGIKIDPIVYNTIKEKALDSFYGTL